MSTPATQISNLSQWLAANPEPTVPDSNYKTLAERNAYMKAKAAHDRWVSERDSFTFADEILASKEAAAETVQMHNDTLASSRAAFNASAGKFLKGFAEICDIQANFLVTQAKVDDYGDVIVAPKASRSSGKIKIGDRKYKVTVSDVTSAKEGEGETDED